MNKNEIKLLIGAIGEEIVGEHLGSRYIKSLDEYDSEKDGTFDELLVEIKTSTRIFSTNEFIYDVNQLFKLTNVDLFFINEIPLNPEDGIVTYLCTNNKQLSLEKRVIDGKQDLFVIVKFNKLLKVQTLKNDPRVDRLVELADQLSPFRREKKAALIETNLEEPTIEDDFFVLNLPKNFNADSVSTIFSRHYKDLHESWKLSGKKLKIVDGDNVISIIESYNTIIRDAAVFNTISNHDKRWLPTGLLAKRNFLKLYDKRFSWTNRGSIEVISYNA
jgi:hypothetical protein